MGSICLSWLLHVFSLALGFCLLAAPGQWVPRAYFSPCVFNFCFCGLHLFIGKVGRGFCCHFLGLAGLHAPSIRDFERRVTARGVEPTKPKQQCVNRRRILKASQRQKAKGAERNQGETPTRTSFGVPLWSFVWHSAQFVPSVWFLGLPKKQFSVGPVRSALRSLFFWWPVGGVGACVPSNPTVGCIYLHSRSSRDIQTRLDRLDYQPYPGRYLA